MNHTAEEMNEIAEKVNLDLIQVVVVIIVVVGIEVMEEEVIPR